MTTGKRGGGSPRKQSTKWEKYERHGVFDRNGNDTPFPVRVSVVIVEENMIIRISIFFVILVIGAVASIVNYSVWHKTGKQIGGNTNDPWGHL